MRYLVINLKQYVEPIERREEMLKALQDLKEDAKKKDVRIILAPQFLECNFYAWGGIDVFTQHINFFEPGRGTGYVLTETLEVNGLKGSLINHSEHSLKTKVVQNTIKRLLESNLEVCVCAKNVSKVKNFSKFAPDFIAIEPPQLIGGNISVSKANPNLITKAVNNSNGVELLVGAGIKTSEDVRVALELGAKGVLVASGIAKAPNYYDAIKELLNGF